MKKVILVLMMLALTVPVYAEAIHNIAGAKFDAPNLIGLKQISPDLFLGAEVSKDLATNIFYSDFAGVEDDHDLRVLAKVTLHTCFWNCPEK